jgi:isopenicillin N synthase-like dioxygenase
MLEFAETPSMPMRLLHYAPQPFKDPSQFGGTLSRVNLFHHVYIKTSFANARLCIVGDHTDYGGITILLAEDNSKGLEVWYPPTETWIEVPIIPGSYVINMGDMMHHWTNGYYRSARHRVVSWNTSEPRYSAPWFLNGKLDLQCTALDGSGASTTPAEHIMARLMATMGDQSGKKLAE